MHYEINALGLRDDEMASTAKPAGTFRVLMVGDSFVQGYTVERSDLFVDLLERWWRAEERDVDVINAGTEGYSTDQEVRWLQVHGREFQPDLVLFFPYENDLYWNAKTSYERYPKPRFNPDGSREMRVLADPGPQPALDRFAIGKLVRSLTAPHDSWSPDGVRSCRWNGSRISATPPGVDGRSQVEARAGALIALKTVRGSRREAVRRADPGQSVHRSEGAPRLRCSDADATGCSGRDTLPRKGTRSATWSPDQPVETFLGLCNEARTIATIDPRGAVGRGSRPQDEPLYFQRDWHFDPAGNRAFARFLHDALTAAPRSGRPPAATARGPRCRRAVLRGYAGWIPVFGVLWVVLSVMYALTYRDEAAWRAPLKIGGMLALVFAIAIGGNRLLALLPERFASAFGALFVVGLLGFIFYKLGRRVGTIVELFFAFIRRGHWYLLPLVVILLTVGSLLVVAASSPLIAPFIYTLFWTARRRCAPAIARKRPPSSRASSIPLVDLGVLVRG